MDGALYSRKCFLDALMMIKHHREPIALAGCNSRLCASLQSGVRTLWRRNRSYHFIVY
jgi:hypothetical protein